MAIAKVGADRATANLNTAVTTVDLVLTGLTVGNHLLIRVAADNSGTSGAARTLTVTNQVGTAIDIATDQQHSQLNDPGAASVGTVCYFLIAKITATSGTVRLTYSGTVVQSCVAEEWSGIDPITPVVGTPVKANGVASTNMASCTDASIAAGNVAYGVVAIEGPATDVYVQDADTTNGLWTALTKLGTGNGTADTNQTVYGAYKIVTAAGAQTHNPTITATARDSAGIIVELAAAPIPKAGTDDLGIGITESSSLLTATSQTLSPDAILTQTNITGVVGDIDEDPDSPDANWMIGTGVTVLRVSFPTPAGDLIAGLPQQFCVRARP